MAELPMLWLAFSFPFCRSVGSKQTREEFPGRCWAHCMDSGKSEAHLADL